MMNKWILILFAFFFLGYRINTRSQYQRWGLHWVFRWDDGTTTYRLFGTAFDEKDCLAMKKINGYGMNPDVVCRQIK